MYLNYYTQRGSALVIAVFVIVVMLALALSMARLLSSSSEAVVYEVQGTRALFAAQSGLDIALTKLFPLGASAPFVCPNLSAPITFNVTSLSVCSVVVSCYPFPEEPEEPEIFRLVSRSECEVSDKLTTSRTVQIEVRQ